MRGRVCVVTGANRGLGKATVTALARLGATVVMLGRDAHLLGGARDDVERTTGNVQVETAVADLASFTSIKATADDIATRHPAIHVLVHNAGVNPARRTLSTDGIELTIAVNHLGPFLLTHELLPALRQGAASGGARIVVVTSMFERFGRIAFDDLQGDRRWIGLVAYAQSKLANVLFTYELAARVAGFGITANCVDPGLVATDLMRDHALFRPRWLRSMWSRVLRSPETGAQAALFAASSPRVDGANGVCFDRRGRVVRTSRRSRDRDARERLWKLSEQLTGVRFT
ncbi:MAG: SDR family oxidoreductase [Gemmatimonadaceae bacterium]